MSAEKIEKLKQVLESLTHLYGVAVEVDTDCASAINTAEDTVQKAIAFYEDGARPSGRVGSGRDSRGQGHVCRASIIHR